MTQVKQNDGFKDLYTNYTYDISGNMLTQQDARNNTTQFKYDKTGRRTSRILPTGYEEAYRYDADSGSLTWKQTFNQGTEPNLITYGYDSLNRLTNKSVAGYGSISYGYDTKNRRNTMDDASGHTGYTYYDDTNMLNTKQSPNGTLTYTYDKKKIKTIVSGNMNGVNITYNYDMQARLQNISDNNLIPQPNTTAYDYYDTGNLKTTTYPSGVCLTWVYNNTSRVKNLTIKDATSQVLKSYRLRVRPCLHT